MLRDASWKPMLARFANACKRSEPCERSSFVDASDVAHSDTNSTMKIFLSYASQDRAVADQINRALLEQDTPRSFVR